MPLPGCPFLCVADHHSTGLNKGLIDPLAKSFKSGHPRTVSRQTLDSAQQPSSLPAERTFYQLAVRSTSGAPSVPGPAVFRFFQPCCPPRFPEPQTPPRRAKAHLPTFRRSLGTLRRDQTDVLRVSPEIEPSGLGEVLDWSLENRITHSCPLKWAHEIGSIYSHVDT